MKTAFAYWDNRIAPVFDTARQIHIVEVQAGRIVGAAQETLSEDMSVQKALRLVELGVSVLVCGAISRSIQEMVVAYGIQVIPFVTGDLCEIVQAWLSGTLECDAFSMPGCCGHGRRRKACGISKEESEMNRRGGGGQGQDGNRHNRGRIGGPPARGAGGVCRCPKCGHLESHECGTPCVQKQCPKCGTAMARE